MTPEEIRDARRHLNRALGGVHPGDKAPTWTRHYAALLDHVDAQEAHIDALQANLNAQTRKAAA